MLNLSGLPSAKWRNSCPPHCAGALKEGAYEGLGCSSYLPGRAGGKDGRGLQTTSLQILREGSNLKVPMHPFLSGHVKNENVPNFKKSSVWSLCRRFPDGLSEMPPLRTGFRRRPSTASVLLHPDSVTRDKAWRVREPLAQQPRGGSPDPSLPLPCWKNPNPQPLPRAGHVQSHESHSPATGFGQA